MITSPSKKNQSAVKQGFFGGNSLFFGFFLLLMGCSNTDKETITGNRETVLLNTVDVRPDPAAANQKIHLETAVHNLSWPTLSGNPRHAMFPSELGNSLTEAWTSSASSFFGDGGRILNGPIVADEKVFTINGAGVITALSLIDGDRVWQRDVTADDKETQPFGGGLAFDDGVVFATTSSAEIVALKGSDGSVLWRAHLAAPVRAAPTVKDNRVYVVTINNQLEVFDAKDGSLVWTHSGILESAGLLGGAGPAVHDGIVVVPYSSGEVFALRAENGYPLWSESLVTPGRLDPLSSLSHIRARPVIDRGYVFLIGHSGQMVAIDVRSGQTVWRLPVGGVRSPALSGDALYVLTQDNQLLCILARTGQIVWIKNLPVFKNPEKSDGRLYWAGPILASGDRLILSGSNGKTVIISAITGEIVSELSLPSSSSISPIIADKTLITMTDNGRLVAFR